jgi:acetyltransferase
MTLESMRKLKVSDSWTTRSGHEVEIRAIRGDDEESMTRFHRSLSPETVYTRYFNVLKLSERITHERLDRVCHPATHQEMVFVVETKDSSPPGRQIVGVGRLSILPETQKGEIAIVISDSWQRQGIGSEVLRRLIKVAGEMKLHRLCAHILSANAGMRLICLNAGMRITGELWDSEMKAELDLSEHEGCEFPMQSDK